MVPALSLLSQEVVVVAEIIRHQINLGLNWRTHARLLKVNDTEIINIRQLIDLLEQLEGEWVILEFDDLCQKQVIFNRQEEMDARSEILSSNNIPQWHT